MDPDGRPRRGTSATGIILGECFVVDSIGSMVVVVLTVTTTTGRGLVVVDMVFLDASRDDVCLALHSVLVGLLSLFI